MPAPVLPGHPGLHARDQAPDRRTMNENGAAPLQESRPSPVRPAPHGRLHRTFRHGTAYGAQGQIAHLSSGSKQNLQKEGDRPGAERIPKEDTSLPGSRKPCKTAPPDAGKGPSCPGPPAGCRKRRGTVPLPCPSPETERGTPFGVPPSFRSVRDADYQLDLRTPGSSPRRAMLRKQIRQMPNWRMKARGRPQMGQRL